MAIYRIHRKEWEKTIHVPRGAIPLPTIVESNSSSTAASNGKRKRIETGAESPEPSLFPGGGRKGVSSGLGLVIKKGLGISKDATFSSSNVNSGTKWWKDLGGKNGKGSMKL